MVSYTGKRLLQTVFVLFGISLITFILLSGRTGRSGSPDA